MCSKRNFKILTSLHHFPLSSSTKWLNLLVVRVTGDGAGGTNAKQMPRREAQVIQR